jgi:hypothetical protein
MSTTLIIAQYTRLAKQTAKYDTGVQSVIAAVRKMWIHITVLYESDVLSHLKFISMFNLVLWKPQPKCWLAERRACDADGSAVTERYFKF